MFRDPDHVRSAVKLLIGLLCGGSLLLILLILVGSEIDETSGKVIGTAMALALLGLTAVAGTILVNRRPEAAAVGYSTAAVSAAAFLALAAAIWETGLFGDDDWRVASDALILSLAGAHASLLLARARPEDSEMARAARAALLGVIALFSLLALVEISTPGEDVGERPIAILAVLYVLGTALLPLVRRVSPPSAAGSGLAREAPPQSAALQGEPLALRLDHLVIGASNLEATIRFYREVLGAAVVSLPGSRVALRVGSQQLNVHTPDTAARPLAAVPVAPGNSDLCFVWSGSLQGAIEHLARCGVPVVEGPLSRTGAQGPGQSVYCRDPDGSLIELISYSG